MILTCPNCGTQYVVKDGAIPPEGRQVRCAACKHSWHQDPEAGAPEDAPAAAPEPAVEQAPDARAGEIADAPPAEDRSAPAQDESLAAATLIEPRNGPEAEERAYDETMIEAEPSAVGTPEIAAAFPEAPGYQPPSERPEPDSSEASSGRADWGEPPVAEAAPDMFSPFAANGEVARRRRSPIAAVLLILLVIVAAAALFWFLAPPAIKAKLGIAAAAATPLQLVTTHMDRSPLESGNELLTVTGRVINPSAKEQDVPPIQAQLKDHKGKVVYSWTIQPPAHSLAAGASASFNSAEINVPPGGDELTISLGEPKA